MEGKRIDTFLEGYKIPKLRQQSEDSEIWKKVLKINEKSKKVKRVPKPVKASLPHFNYKALKEKMQKRFEEKKVKELKQKEEVNKARLEYKAKLQREQDEASKRRKEMQKEAAAKRRVLGQACEKEAELRRERDLLEEELFNYNKPELDLPEVSEADEIELLCQQDDLIQEMDLLSMSEEVGSAQHVQNPTSEETARIQLNVPVNTEKKKKSLRCWKCSSRNHTKGECPNISKGQLKRLAKELNVDLTIANMMKNTPVAEKKEILQMIPTPPPLPFSEEDSKRPTWNEMCGL